MFCHWRYVLDHTFGAVRAVSCTGATHIPVRIDEAGKPYTCTAEDAAYGSFELKGGIFAQINSSWVTRVYRDELVSLHVDGTEGSAVAGLRDCKVQHRVNTPRPVWNPDLPNPFQFRDQWAVVPDNAEFDNAFKVQWEMFLRHVECGAPFPHDFMDGARGVQLAELALASWHERRWVDVPEISLNV
jgi:predicted dehydrogenase